MAGSVGTLAYGVAYYALTEFFGFWYIASAAIAWVLNWGINFKLQKSWTFQNEDSRGVSRQLKQYCVMAVGFLLLNALLLHVLVEHLRFGYLVAQVTLIPVFSVASFFITRKIFKQKVQKDENAVERVWVPACADVNRFVGAINEQGGLNVQDLPTATVLQLEDMDGAVLTLIVGNRGEAKDKLRIEKSRNVDGEYEGTLTGSGFGGCMFKTGWIGVGMRLEFYADKGPLSIIWSKIKSISVVTFAQVSESIN